MALYEYECDACHERFEKIQKFSDPPPDACPKCGRGPVRKLFSSPAIQFKGTGWYVTDYAKKSSTDAGKGGPADKSDSARSEGSNSDGGKSEGGKTGSAASDTGSASKTDAGSSTSTNTPASKPSTKTE